ncbi:MAG: alkyl hydroperoxide reductase subunit C [Ignavibacteriales bacterium]|nr:alkyl hydroperoxide reductase subunit C [Ignavibacteriales bacterium]
MVKIGQRVQDFTLDAYQNEKFFKFSLSERKGKWVVAIFYPADFTFVCPTELEDAADLYDAFKKAGAEVVSISTDTHFTHKAWHDESPAIKKIKFPMLADPTGSVTREFGVYIDDAGLALRGTFIIDPDGVLMAYEVNDNSIGRSAAETLRKLNAAIYVRENDGEVCPAKWVPGQKTLKPGIDLVGKI